MAEADPDRLNSLGNDITRTIELGVTDKTSVFFGRNDLLEQARLNVKSTLLRAGVEQVSETPETLAQKAHDRAFSQVDMNPALVAALDERIDALEKDHTEAGLVAMAADLRKELGEQRYAEMVRDAHTALGEEPPLAARADMTILRALAAQGAYLNHYHATAPGGPKP